MEGKKNESEEEKTGRNQERKRGKAELIKESGFPYKGTRSHTAGFAIRLFDAESKTGIPWDICASAA